MRNVLKSNRPHPDQETTSSALAAIGSSIDQTDCGSGVSNTSVKDMVAEMFKGENQNKPLSDQEIVKMLKEKGIVIARRTVAKYRAELNILPSNLRKVY